MPVDVCIETQVALDDRVVLERAESTASTMFALVHVAVAWHRDLKVCPLDRDPILVSLSAHTPATFYPGAYGTAMPYEGVHIQLSLDRVRQLSRPELVTPLLAHVLVHEITHILQGTDGHSNTGIMKARWDRRDLEHINVQPLSFSAFDVSLLRLGLASRPARVAAARTALFEFTPAE